MSRPAFPIAFTFAMLGACAPITPAVAPLAWAPGPVLPGIVQSERSDIKLAVAPDGRTLVWGVAQGGGKLVLRMSRRSGETWSAPAAVSFASAKDFDPSFSPDGRWLYFFSDRPGGLGDDDIWRVPFTMATGEFGVPQNLGPLINSKGREWAPGVSPDGHWLLFASDGRGGAKQDLYRAPRVRDGWGATEPVAAVDGPEDDFDGTFLADGSLVFSRGNSDDGPVQLYYAPRLGNGFGEPRKLGPKANCADFVNGPSTSPAAPGQLFVSAACPPGGTTRMDIIALSVDDALMP